MGSTEQEVFCVQSWLARDQGRRARPIEILRPQQVGCWTKESVKSATQAGQYSYGSKNGLMEFASPQLPQDLNEGYPEAFERKPEDEGTPVETIIRGAMHSSTLSNLGPRQQQQQQQCFEQQHARGLIQGADVVTFRNNLNKICGTPLSPRDGWVVEACMHNNTLFLDISKSEQASFPDADRFNYYGYKFESLCTAVPPQGSEIDGGGRPEAPTTSRGHPIVDSTSEYAILVKVKLGQQSILMAAEVDCVDPAAQSVAPGSTSSGGSPATPMAPYLELKTYKIPDHPGQRKTLYSQKYPKWWLQSFLAGVPELILGGRDNKGFLKEVQRIPVQELPSAAEKAGHKWDAWKLLRFGEDVLGWMQSVSRLHPGQALRFEYKPDQGRISWSARHGDDTLAQRLQQILPN
ncbi:hypothetical protein DUNSADRAFT_12907 [Dunaliella salina]|uniref:Decapping nuclease n=1 Tax=Dunaliella salina TaxID=3046 RepID=A0ABQ7H3L9_DUNSA|nr:hypothetical protein DUNSADRAFT_12907 [Dunaliella salina]|eukprot:KAF5841463.1 hypothetical protein DUNSADRAFT_12907 [Dunaliella salina]